MSTKYFLNQDCIAENISASGRFMVPHISVVNSISGIVDEVNINLSDRITTVSATLERTIQSVSSDITGIIDDIDYIDNGDIPAYVISSVNQDGGKITVGRRKLTTEDISGLAIIPDDFNGKADHRIKFEYNHDTKKIILGINNKPADTYLSIDCDDFIKDGMLSDVYTEEEQSGYPQLVFVWNTDAGHTTTKIDIRRILGHIYNAGEYLTFDIDRYEFDVDLPKLTDKLNINKMLKYVGHINNPTTISSNYLSGIFSGIIETDSVLNGTFVDVGFSDPTVSATTLDNELTVGKGDIIVVHSHANQVEIDKKDLVFGQNVFVIKAGVSRYEFEALKPSLQLDDISLSGAEAVSVITGIGETGGIVHISAETLVPTMISGLNRELDNLSCAISSKIFIRNFDGLGNEITAFDDLSVLKMTVDEYRDLVLNDKLSTLSNSLFVISTDYINAYGTQVKNVGDATQDYDAVNMRQLVHVSSDITDVVSAKIFFKEYDNPGVYGNLSVVKVKEDDYAQILSSPEGANLQTIYIVSSENTSMCGERITDLSDGIDDYDAVNLKQLKKKIFIRNYDKSGNELTAFDDLSVLKITIDDYKDLVESDEISALSNSLFVISSNNVDALMQRITNLGDGVDDYDAVNMKQFVRVSSDIANATNTKIFFKEYDNPGEYNNLSVVKISMDEYENLLNPDSDVDVDEHTIYFISSDNKNAYGEKIVNLADGTDPTDAINKSQLTNCLSGYPNLSSINWNSISLSTLVDMVKFAFSQLGGGQISY